MTATAPSSPLPYPGAVGPVRRRRWDDDLPPVRGVAVRLFLVGVFLMPAQLEIGAFSSVVDTRLPPGDLFLALSILVLPTSLRFRRRPLAMLPVAMVLTISWGAIIALVYAGELTSHSIFVKWFGAVVLAIWCLVTITHVRNGHGPRIMRTWLIGMLVLGVVAYLEWKYVDVPFLNAKSASRFVGVQHEPNNAGAAYAVATVMMWQYGARLFPNRVARLAMVGGFLFFQSQTYSRGGWIAFGAAVVALVVMRTADMRTWGRYLLIATALGIAAVATGLIDNSIDEWEQRPDTVGARDELLEVGMTRFVDSRGLGIGLGTYLRDNEEIVHNTAAWLLMEMSVVGLAFFGAMIIVPFQAGRRLRRIDPGYAYALLGAHVVMITASNGIEAIYQRQWWLIVGLLARPLVAPARAGPDVGHDGLVVGATTPPA